MNVIVREYLEERDVWLRGVGVVTKHVNGITVDESVSVDVEEAWDGTGLVTLTALVRRDGYLDGGVFYESVLPNLSIEQARHLAGVLLVAAADAEAGRFAE